MLYISLIIDLSPILWIIKKNLDRIPDFGLEQKLFSIAGKAFRFSPLVFVRKTGKFLIVYFGIIVLTEIILPNRSDLKLSLFFVLNYNFGVNKIGVI